MLAQNVALAVADALMTLVQMPRDPGKFGCLF